LRKMNVRDGYAVKRAIRAGYHMAIITGGNSEGVAMRLKGLGIEDVFSGVQNKLEVFQRYIDQKNIDPQGILYMGDDLPDREVMQRVGFPVCPSDAAQEIRKISDYISPFPGGHGCVRDVIEKTMKLADKWL
jgi:3-deoxy-D-manno-octulosonate 8-phosphate phosphatase (KDO 8-P phosphatase)